MPQGIGSKSNKFWVDQQSLLDVLVYLQKIPNPPIEIANSLIVLKGNLLDSVKIRKILAQIEGDD